MKRGEAQVGMRIVHKASGMRGVITNSPQKVFNGWTIRLDGGQAFGVDESQIDREPPRDILGVIRERECVVDCR